MRSIAILLAAWLSTLVVSARQIQVGFDECVDLMATVWHLAGAREYNMCAVAPYAESLDAWCAPLKGHKAVALAQQYYRDGIGYDAVVAFGKTLRLKDDGVETDADMLQMLDDRWSPDMWEEFLPALDDFYRRSDFHKWYLSTDSIRQATVEAFDAVAEQIDIPWFGKFFNDDGATFSITLSLLDGGCNYGLSAKTKDGRHVLTPVIGCARYEDGHIGFNTPAVLPIVIHEFCHAYCNPLIDSHYSAMEQKAAEVFQHYGGMLRRQAYTNPVIMMYETLVRSSVITYLRQHRHLQSVEVKALVAEEEQLGFALTATLVEGMENLQTSASGAQGLKALMPDLVKRVNAFNVKAYEKRKKAEKRKADRHRVHYRSNIRDGARNVPAGEMCLTIIFDRPMREAISLGLTDKEFPAYKGHAWSDDKRTLTVNFVTKPSTAYGLSILGDGFIAQDGTPSVASEIRFTTAAER